MRSFMRIVVLIIVMVLYIGCAKPYTYDDNNTTVELGLDDPFQIVLEGDNSPDFNWELKSIPEFIELETRDKVNDKGRVIDYLFSFKTISYGKGILELIYTNGQDVKKTFQITVFAGVMGIITSE